MKEELELRMCCWEGVTMCENDMSPTNVAKVILCLGSSWWRPQSSTNGSLKDINPCALFLSLLKGIWGLGKSNVGGVGLEVDNPIFT